MKKMQSAIASRVSLGLATVFMLGFFSIQPAEAGLVADRCHTSNVQLTRINLSSTDASGNYIDGAQIWPFSGSGPSPQLATSCYYYDDPVSDDPVSHPNPNIGGLDDGLLNGEGDYLDPWDLVDDSTRTDINGDGEIDPGWIHLAHVSESLITGYDSSTKDGTTIDIADVLNISMTCTSGSGECTGGSWSLMLDPDIVAKVSDVLGPSTFDHLALVLKSGDKGYAIYDFYFGEDFLTTLFGSSGDGDFLYTTAANFHGTWSMGDFTNPNGKLKAVSHANWWAGDPPGGFTVPVPAPLMLIGIGFAAFGFVGLRAKR